MGESDDKKLKTLDGVFRVVPTSDHTLTMPGISGWELVELFHEDVEQVRSNYEPSTGLYKNEHVTLRQGRLLMRQSTDVVLQNLEHERNTAIAEKAKALSQVRELEMKVKSLGRDLELQVLETKCKDETAARLDAKLKESEVLRRKMEDALGKVREKLGTERFEELVR